MRDVRLLRPLLRLFERSEEGASAVEYGLLIALIAVALMVAVATLGGNLAGLFNGTASSISR